VGDDVEHAADLSLQIPDFVVACMEVDDAYRLFGVSGDDEGVHDAYRRRS
jgi:hypothetical protein